MGVAVSENEDVSDGDGDGDGDDDSDSDGVSARERERVSVRMFGSTESLPYPESKSIKYVVMYIRTYPDRA